VPESEQHKSAQYLRTGPFRHNKERLDRNVTPIPTIIIANSSEIQKLFDDAVSTTVGT
jgi:hypothetical protein